MKVQNDLQNKNSLNLFLNQYFNLFTLLLLLIIFAFAYFLIIGPKFQSTTTTIKDNIVGQKRLYTEQEKKLRDLKTFEANTRLFDIESVNFSQAESSAQLEFVTYYYKPVQ